MNPRIDWTFLFYCGTNHNGFHYSRADLEKLLEGAVIGPNVNFIYEIAGAVTTERGRVRMGATNKPLAEPIEEPQAVDYATPHAVADFFDWATERFPSRRTALILKNHGSASQPPPKPEFPRPSERNPPEVTADERLRGRSGLGQILDDGQKRRYLSDRELRTVVKSTKRQRVDIYGFDACEMSTIEVAYEVRNVASHMIAAEEPLGISAFLYARALTYCSKNVEVGSRKLAKELSPKAPPGPGSTNLIAIDLAEVADVARALDQVADVLCNLLGKDFATIDGVQAKLTRFPEAVEYDLLQVLDELKLAFPQNADLAKPIADAKQALTNAWHGTPPLISNPCGLGIFFPALNGINDMVAYGGLAFPRETRWGEFLARYVAKKLPCTNAALGAAAAPAPSIPPLSAAGAVSIQPQPQSGPLSSMNAPAPTTDPMVPRPSA